MAQMRSSGSLAESAVGSAMDGGGSTAAEPSNGLEKWWTIAAALVGPPAVDPAIYGIDPSDVGGVVGGLGAGVKHQAASNELAGANRHQPPSSMNGFISMSNAVSAQATPQKTRADHLNAAEGARSRAMSDHLMLAARKIISHLETLESLAKKQRR